MKDAPSLAHSPQKRPRLFYGWYIVFSQWAMLFISTAVSIGIFFKPILEEFKLDRAQLSLLYTAASLLFAVVTPFLGRLVDRYGPRVLIFLCLGTQTLSSVANGLAHNLALIFTGRFLYDIKALQASQVMVNHWFVKKRGLAQGIMATGMPIGTLLLVPLSQYMILIWDWRPTMLFWAAVTLVLGVPLAIMVRNRPEEKGFVPDGSPPDKESPADFSLKPAEEKHDVAPSGRGLAESARTSSFWLLMTTALICGIGCGFMMTHIVIFATDFGYSEMIGASFLAVQGGVNLLGVLVTGHWSDKFARNRVLGVTHIIRASSFFVVVAFILISHAPLWMLFAAMALFGFGWFTTAPLTSGLIADLFGGMRMGTIIGVLMTFHTVGMALGAYGGGLTYTFFNSYFWFFLIQGVLELVAAGCAFAIKWEEKSRKLRPQAIANC